MTNQFPFRCNINPAKILMNFISIVVISLFLTACGGGSDGDGEPENSAFNLTEQDFDVVTNSLSATEFEDELNGTIDFLSSENVLFDISTHESHCIFDKISDVKAKRTADNTYEVDLKDKDVTECFSIQDAQLYSVIFSIYADNLIYKDSSGNEIQSEFVTTEEMAQYTKVQSNIRTFLTIKGEIKIADNTVVHFEIKTISTSNKTGSFNEPCLRNPKLTECTDTIVYETKFQEEPSENSITKTVLNASNLTVVANEPYYADGKIEFEINNWTGIMTYHQDATIAPDYTATDGTDSVTGTFQYNDGSDGDHQHQSAGNISVFQSPNTPLINTLNVLRQSAVSKLKK